MDNTVQIKDLSIDDSFKMVALSGTYLDDEETFLINIVTPNT